MPLERTSRVTGMALTRGVRSGAATCPGRSGSRTGWLSSEGRSLRGLAGRPVLGPIGLLGLLLYESGSLGVPDLYPHQDD